jgi:hypothetical protein
VAYCRVDEGYLRLGVQRGDAARERPGLGCAPGLRRARLGLAAQADRLGVGLCRQRGPASLGLGQQADARALRVGVALPCGVLVGGLPVRL